MNKRIIILIALLLSAACTDRACAKFAAKGQPHIVRLYAADGHVIQEWESTGIVECSDGGICSFMDAKTRKFVATTGDIVVMVK
jgi:hypothetical protein